MDNPQSTMFKVEQLLKNEQCDIRIVKNGNEYAFNFPQNRVYTIPAYQREIRWKKENIRLLINDINNGPKFLGTILLSTKDNLHFSVIDGQQRITMLILVISYIKKKLEIISFSLCNYQNDTYTGFFEALGLDFCLDRIIADENGTEILKSDILEQRPLLADLWSEIKGQIDRFTTAELRAFKDKLFACEINVLLNKEDGGTSSKQICVDYYLDLNDKSVELDSIDILKACLFKIDFDLMTEKWADVQKSIKNLHNNKINNYSISTFYYHYFACTVNKALDYKLNTLKTDLKLGKDIVLGSSSPSAKYTADTHIVTAIPNNQYFNNTIENLKKVSDYFSLIAKLKGPWPEFTESFHGKCQDSTVQCAFLIMYEILRNDDEVPKMLLMKYIIDVLQNPESKKSDYECIFDIYCYSILFTASSGKKNSQQLTRIVMSENWIEKLKEASAAMYQKNINKIVYNRPVTEDGNVTEKSGQYLPKYIFAIKEFYKLSSDAKRLDIKKRPLFVFLSNKSASAEHFFINQSYNFEFVYGNNRKATIPCPKKLKKYISYSANYLYVNYEDNASMEELSIFDKIQFLKAKGKSVFSCSWCNKYFLKAREIFESGKYPNNLNTITDESTAKEMVLEYYNRYFEDELKQYIPCCPKKVLKH